jgi:predicted DCC family thiol-disulfide oxidoreductase YuxK
VNPDRNTAPLSIEMLDRARGRNIVFFDGECVLCENSIEYLFRRDRRRRLSFATLQGPLGNALFAEHSPREAHLSSRLKSIVYATEYGTGFQRVHTRSTALLQIARDLGGRWGVAAALLRFIPPPLRNAAYEAVAKNRYRWFGHKDTPACFLPPPEDRDRFFQGE